MKEETNYIEREFKILPPPDCEEEVLNLVRRLKEPGAFLVKWQPLAVLDVYLDTPDMTFNRAGATFRLRKRRLKPGWNANFKPATTDRPFMERREVRTSLSVDETLAWRKGKIPGLAASLAYDLARDRGDKGSLAARLLLVTYRNCYAVRPCSFEGKALNLIFVMFDEVTAFDLAGVDTEPLLRWGSLDYAASPASVKFSLMEIEASGRDPELGSRPMELLIALGSALDPARFPLVHEPKYQMSLRMLGLTGDGIRHCLPSGAALHVD